MKGYKKGIKYIFMGFLSFCMVLSIAGCNNTKMDASKDRSTSLEIDTGASEDATKMEMWVFVELHSKFYGEMIRRWNQQHPDRQLDIRFVALPYDDMHNKLQMALQSGKGAPDLCDIEVGKFPNFLMGEPQLESLNDVVEPYKDSIVQSRLDLYSKDGNIYGLPTHVGATVMFYNTEILEEAGVDYTQIETWDDYILAGKKVVEETSKSMGVAETNAMWTLSALLAQQSSDYVTDDGKPNVNSKEMIKAMTLIQDMLNEGIIEVCPGGQPDTEEGFGYINEGNVASMVMPLWFMSRFLDYMPDLNGKIAIAPVPVFEKGMPRSVGLGGTGTVVTKTAVDTQLAKEFLAFAKLSEEANMQVWKVLGFDPVNTNLWKNKEITHDEENKFVQYFVNNPFEVLNEVEHEIELIRSLEITPSINNVIGTQVLNDINENGADPEATLNDAQAQLENELGL